jgi:hypothetical protein
MIRLSNLVRWTAAGIIPTTLLSIWIGAAL